MNDIKLKINFKFKKQLMRILQLFINLESYIQITRLNCGCCARMVRIWENVSANFTRMVVMGYEYDKSRGRGYGSF